MFVIWVSPNLLIFRFLPQASFVLSKKSWPTHPKAMDHTLSLFTKLCIFSTVFRTVIRREFICMSGVR